MKYLNLSGVISTLILILIFNNGAFAQNNPIKIPDGIQHSKDAINQDDWNLVDYQFKVDEIQTKIDYVKNNPEENTKATANNWFETAYKVLAEAKYERDTHIDKFLYKKIKGFPRHVNTGNIEQDNALYDKKIKDWVHAHPLTSKDHGTIK